MAKNIRKAVLLLAMFTACGNKKSDDGRTTFTVGFDAEFPPYGYKDDSGEYVGFDLDLAQEVCERNGWNLVKQPIDWDSKDMELSSGSIDCIWNGFTLNGREREYTWSKARLSLYRLIHQLLQHLQERMQQKKILHLRHNLRHFSRYLIITQHL